MDSARELEKQLEEKRKSRAQFIELAKKEEAHSLRDPAGYRRRVAGLMALAYGYIALILLLALALLIYSAIVMFEARRGGSIGTRFVFYIGLFVFAILSSLWIKVAPPKGVVLTRSEAPDLYREVDRIADTLQAARVDEIRLDYNLNAAASQTPQFGLVGIYRNVLLLGMPLLLGLAPDEARAVIAHEFGHFSGSHGKFGARVYRLEMTLRQIVTRLSTTARFGALLFMGFIKWFYPRFSATTFAMRRANEYEADRAAAQVAGAGHIVNALLRMKYLAPQLQKSFWNGLGTAFKASPEPFAGCLIGLPEAARHAASPVLAIRAVEASMTDVTGYDDTHPCLSDRLRALGQLPESMEARVSELAKPLERTAAEAFFGDGMRDVLGRVERHYRDEVSEKWAKSHATYLRNAEALRHLRIKGTTETLTEQDEFEIAMKTLNVEGAEAGEAELRAFVAKYPDNGKGQFWLGWLLVDKEDMAAEPYLQRSIELYPSEGARASELLRRLYRSNGMYDQLQKLREEAEEFRRERKIIHTHALSLRLNDDFVPHDASPAKIESLQRQLRELDDLERAYFVRKILPNGEHRAVLIGFPKRKFLAANDEPRKLSLAMAKLSFGEGTTCHSPRSEKKNWIRRLDSIPGALIYSDLKSGRNAT